MTESIKSWICKKCGKLEHDIVCPELFHLCPPSVYKREKRRERTLSPKGESAKVSRRRIQVQQMLAKGDLSEITTRHLIYHVYPAKKNDLWLDNLHWLIPNLPLFNGRRCIAVATSEATHSLDAVREMFGDHEVELIPFDNDPLLREVATFPSLITKCHRMKEHEAVFYAHTKGNATGDDPQGALIWRNAAYDHLLNRYYELVEPALRKNAAVGIHKMIWPFDSVRSPYPTNLRHGNWMFAGTFFWFRPAITHNCDDWRNVPVDRYGAEAWLGGLLPHDVVESVYQVWEPELSVGDVNPYDPNTYPKEDQERYGNLVLPVSARGRRAVSKRKSRSRDRC